jgi:hypothetical protein
VKYLFTGLLKPLKRWIETLCHLKNKLLSGMINARHHLVHCQELNEIVLKSNKILHNELKIIQVSQQFMGNKFDDLLESFRLLKAENVQLKDEVSRAVNTCYI